MTTTSPADRGAAALRTWPFGGHRPASLASSALHLLLDLPLAIVTFVLTVTFLALAAGLLPLYPVALAAFAVWFVIVHGVAAFERARVRALLDVAITAPTSPPSEGGWHTRSWARLRHHTTWRATTYHLVRLPLAIVSFTVLTLAVALPVALLAIPFTLVGLQWPPATGWALVLSVVGPLIGLAVLPLAAAAIEAAAALDAAVAASLLGDSEADRRERRIEQLTSTRSELVDIAEQERRRIERDLHDGAGQQLVSLAMTLGMAREKLARDPASAQALIDEAHGEAKRALVGLREIVRGISPAILNDRGLGAALSAVASRSTVPVQLDVDVPERPDPVTEGIAYYVVCEAIGNALRHARASAIDVAVVRRGEVLEVAVSDDGRGGADPSRGTGLRGLAGRVAAVDGDLEVSSPDGGPTQLRASLPIRTVEPTPSTEA